MENSMDNIKSALADKFKISKQDICLRHQDKLTKSGYNDDLTLWLPPSFRAMLPNKEDGFIADAKNAVLNDIIIREFVKYLPLEDLKACRQVCKKWNQNTIPRFRREYEISFNFHSLDGNKKLEDFEVLLESTDVIPFGNIEFYNLPKCIENINKCLSLVGSSLKRVGLTQKISNINFFHFWRHLLFCSPCLESLSVYECPMDNYGLIHHKWADMHPWWIQPDINLPKLKQLKKITYEAHEITEYSKKFLAEVLSAACNLDEATFNCSGNTVTSIQKSGNFIKLQKLFFCKIYENDVQSLITLSTKGLRLKELALHLTNDVTKKSVEELIARQSNSLESFRVVSYAHIPMEIRIPRMTKLKKFEASDTINYISLHHPIVYGKEFPNLTEVLLNKHTIDVNWDSYFPEGVTDVTCLSVRKIRTPVDLFSVGQFKRLTTLFPCVKMLEIGTQNREILSHLWQSWPNLESLDMILNGELKDIDSCFILGGQSRDFFMFEDNTASPQRGIWRLKQYLECPSGLYK